jgi:hypothetical protein
MYAKTTVFDLILQYPAGEKAAEKSLQNSGMAAA